MSEMFCFDSDEHPGDEAFEHYRLLYAGGSDVERTADPFHARVRGWRLDRTLLFTRAYGGVRHRRRERVASDGFDHFVLHHVVGGELLGGPDGAPIAVGPGETLLLDTRRPMENGARDVDLVTVSLARDAVRAAAGHPDDLHGRRIAAADGVFLATLLRTLVAEAPRLPPGTLSTATRMLVDALSMAVNPAGQGARSDFYRLEYARREAAQRLIEARLDARDFSIAEITAETGTSRATLYRLFEAQGGVLRYIQLRRLQRLRDRLDDRSFDRHPLAELAALSGFSGESHAGRLFKRVFGVAPGAYRAASIRGTRVPSVDLMARRWTASMAELD